MANEELTHFIKQYLAQGYSKEQLRQHLLAEGHAPQAVDAAFRSSADVKPHLTLLFGSALLLLIIFVGVFSYFSSPEALETRGSSQDVLPQIAQTPQEKGSLAGEGAPVPEPVPASESTPVCDTRDCAEPYFKSCSPFKGTYTHFFVIEVAYEVLGPKDGFCEVAGKVLSAPKAGFTDKEMTCLYNNTLSLDDAVKDISRCQGPLADALKKEFG